MQPDRRLGHTSRYAQAVRSFTQSRWEDASWTFTMGARQGSFPGMPSGHTFNVVTVSNGHGVGAEPVVAPDKVIFYTGTKVTASF